MCHPMRNATDRPHQTPQNSPVSRLNQDTTRCGVPEQAASTDAPSDTKIQTDEDLQKRQRERADDRLSGRVQHKPHH